MSLFLEAPVSARNLPLAARKLTKGPGMPAKPSRYRSLSLTDVDGGFCRLEMSIPAVVSTDLPELVAEADLAIKAGVTPTLSEGAMGGTYFLRDAWSQHICVVFKPADEEPFAPNNPYNAVEAAGRFHRAYKGNIFPGFGMYRELVAFSLDHGGAGVPATQLAKVRHRSFRSTENCSHNYKIGSVQSYVRDIECSAEDMGPGMFHSDDIQRVALLDIRLCNLDRHPGNLLVCHSKAVYAEEMLPKHQAKKTPMIPEDAELPHPPPMETGGDISKSCPADIGSFMFPTPRFNAQDEERDSCHSPSPRAVNDNGISPRTSSSSLGGGKLRLVPIDHGYCLPHVLHLSETNFCWLYWPQAAAPVSEELREYIMNLDADKDCSVVHSLVGAAISDQYMLTLRVCTMLLQKGVAGGLTLKRIGQLMTVEPTSASDSAGPESGISPLQQSVYRAIEAVNRKSLSASHDGDMTPSRPITSRMKHSPSESSLVDMDVTGLGSPPRPTSSRSPTSLNFKIPRHDCTLACPVPSMGRWSPSGLVDAGMVAARSPSPKGTCTDLDLHRAMSVDSGAALLESLSMCITDMVMDARKPVSACV